MRVANLVFAALSSLALAEPREVRDAGYWADRMEQALLPTASLRAEVTLETFEPARGTRTLRAQLARVQGPTRIRSVLTVRAPVAERQVIKTASTRASAIEQVRYAGGSPLALPADRHDSVLRSAFSYLDLGFLEVAPLFRDAEVALEESVDGRRVRMSLGPEGPYGRIVARLDPETAHPIELAYYDREDPTRLVRTVRFAEFQRAHPFRFPRVVEAREFPSGRRSTLRFERVVLGASIYEHEFGDAHLRETLRELLALPAIG